MIWCNWGQISISFDVSNSTSKKMKKSMLVLYMSNIRISYISQKSMLVFYMSTTYRSLSIKIPRSRGHILGNVRIDFLSIFIEFSWRKPRFTRLLQLNLLAVVLPGLKCHCNPRHTSLKNTHNGPIEVQGKLG